MSFDNERLPKLIQQIERKAEVNEKIRELSIQRGPINKQVLKLEFELEQAVKLEQDLEKGGISAFLQNLGGKLEQKRNDAHNEVRSIKSEYDKAVYLLNDIDSNIARVQDELANIVNCEKEYDHAFDEKVQAIKASSHPQKAQIITIEKELSILQEHNSIFKKFRSLANEVKRSSDYILYYNNSAPEVTFADVMTKSRYELHQAYKEEREYAQGLKKMKKEACEEIEIFAEKLPGLTEVAEIYTKTGFIKFCLGIMRDAGAGNYDAKTVVEEIIRFNEGLDSLIEIVNNRYNEIKKGFNELVLRIRL